MGRRWVLARAWGLWSRGFLLLSVLAGRGGWGFALQWSVCRDYHCKRSSTAYESGRRGSVGGAGGMGSGREGAWGVVGAWGLGSKCQAKPTEELGRLVRVGRPGLVGRRGRAEGAPSRGGSEQ